jgi:hypothetical protein
MTRTQIEEDLLDLFDVAIVDSIDLDWRTTDGARACVKALLAEPDLLAALANIQQGEVK